MPSFVERLVLVCRHSWLVAVHVIQRIFTPVVMIVVVFVNRLGFEPCDGVEFLDLRCAKPGERTEDGPFDLGHLSIFDCIDKGVLCPCRMALEFCRRVFLTKWS